MSEVVSRRDFLKGSMAAASVTALSPAVLDEWAAILLPPDAPAAAPAPASDVHAGDFWMRSAGGKWAFIGTATAMSIEREVVETTTFGDLAQSYLPSGRQTMRTELVVDHDGVSAALRLLEDYLVEVRFGLGGDLIADFDAAFTAFDVDGGFSGVLIGACRFEMRSRQRMTCNV